MTDNQQNLDLMRAIPELQYNNAQTHKTIFVYRESDLVFTYDFPRVTIPIVGTKAEGSTFPGSLAVVQTNVVKPRMGVAVRDTYRDLIESHNLNRYTINNDVMTWQEEDHLRAKVARWCRKKPLWFLRSRAEYARRREASATKIVRRARLPRVIRPHLIHPLVEQSGYSPDYDTSSSSGDEDEAIQLRRLRRLQLVREPERPRSVVEYLNRTGKARPFRMACQDASRRASFLRSVHPLWRGEVRKCLIHRVDVSMDKMLLQSGEAMAFMVGCAAGYGSRVAQEKYVSSYAAVQQAVATAKETVENKAKAMFSFLMRMIVSSAQLLDALMGGSMVARMAALAQMSLLLGEKGVDHWVGSLVDHVSKMASNFRAQSSVKEKSPLIKSVVEILSKAISLSFFSKAPYAMQFCVKACMNAFNCVVEGVDFFEALTKGFHVVVSGVSDFVSSGDVSALFGKDEESSMLAELEVIEDEILLASRSQLVETQHPRIVRYRARVEEIRYKYIGNKSMHNPIFTAKLSIVRDMIASFLRNMNNTRREPLGFIIAGDPGVGKTTLTDRVASMIRAKHDIDESMEVFWTYQPTKHQTIPAVVLGVQINDAFQLKDELEPMLPLLQSLVDKTIMKAEGASIREKEMSAVRPEVVLISTNVTKYVFTTIVGDVTKLARRYSLICMTWSDWAKEQAFSGGYDVSKTWERVPEGTQGMVEYHMGELLIQGNTMFLDRRNMVRPRAYANINKMMLAIFEMYHKSLNVSQTRAVVLCKHGVQTAAECAQFPCDPLEASKQNVVSHVAASTSIESQANGSLGVGGEDVAFTGVESRVPAYMQAFIQREDVVTELGIMTPSLVGLTSIVTEGFAKNARPATAHIMHDGNAQVFIPVHGLPEGEWECYLNTEEYTVALSRLTAGERQIITLSMGSEAENFIFVRAYHRRVVWTACDLRKKFVKMPFPINIERCGKDYKIAPYSLWASGMLKFHVIGACLAMCAVYQTGRTVYSALNWMVTRQGAIHGEVRDIPNVHSPAEVLIRSNVPWLGGVSNEKALLPLTGVLHSGKNNLHFVVYSPGIVTFAKHFLKFCDENAEIHFDFGEGVVITDRFSEHKVYRDTADAAFYFLGQIPGMYVCLEKVCPDLPEQPSQVVFRGKLKDVSSLFSTRDVLALKGVETKAGDCGELYMCNNAVVAMHVGIIESTDTAYAVKMSKEMGEKAKRHFLTRGMLMAPSLDILPQSVKDEIQDTDENMARADMYYLHKLASRRESIFSGMIPLGCKKGMDTMKPSCHRTTHYAAFSEYDPVCCGPNMGHAKLIDGAYVSPITKRFEAGQLPSMYSMSLAKAVVTWYASKFGVGKNGLVEKLQPTTLFTALVGHPLNGLIGPKALDKAVGYDLRKLKVTKSNAFVLAADGKWVVHPAVLSEVEAWKHAVEHDIPKAFVATASVKDEVKLLSDVEKGKGRLFYIPPMAFNLLLKMYFAPIVAHLYSRPAVSGMYAAINPTSRDWDNLANWLNSRGGIIFEGDQSAFDNRHSWILNIVVIFCSEIMDNLGYSTCDRIFALKLLVRSFDYILLMSGGFYMCNTKMLSGLWLTLFINCLATIILTHMANAMAVGELVMDEVSIATVGDDLLEGVSKRLAAILKLDRFADAMREMGYVFTPTSKNEKSLTFRTLNTASFLKRSFHYEGGLCHARLAKESLFKTLCYSVTTKDEGERDKNAYLSVLHEAVLWGEEFFNEMYNKGVALGYAPPTYDELYDKFKTGNYRTWEIGNRVVEVSAHYHDEDDAFLPKDVLSNEPMASITNEDLEMVLQVGFISPTERTLDNSSDVSLLNNNGPVTSVSVIDKSDAAPSHNYKPLYAPKQIGTLDNFWARKRRVQLLTISSSTFTNTVLNPATLFFNIPAVKDVIDQYQGIRYTMEINFVYTGSTVSCGAVRASAVPVLYDDLYTPLPKQHVFGNGEDFTISSTRLHVDMNLSEACMHTLMLPYSNQYNFVNPFDNQWKVQVQEILPLVSVNGLTPTPILLEVLVSLHDVELYNMIPQSGEGQRYWSDMLGRASAITGLVPGTFTTSISQALGVAGSVAQLAGYKKIPVEESAVSVVRRTPNTASTVGVDTGYHLTLDEVTQTNTSHAQFPLGAVEDMDLKYQLERYGQLRLEWAAGSAGRVYCWPGNVNFTNPAYFFTPLAYFAAPFKFWSGSLKYKVVINTSPLVRWRMGLVILPPGRAPSAGFPVGGDYQTFEVEVSGCTEFEFEVPYLRDDNFCLNYTFPNTLPEGEVQSSIVYYSLMDPTGPAVSVPQPYVSLWVKAGSDFSVAVPTNEIIGNYTPQSGKSVATFGESPTFKDLILLKVPVLKLSYNTTIGPSYYMGSWNFPADGYEYSQLTAFTWPPGYLIDSQGVSFTQWLKGAYIGYNGGSSACVIFTPDQPEHPSASIGVDMAVPGMRSPPVNTLRFPSGSSTAASVVSTIEPVVVTYPSRNTANWKCTRGTFQKDAPRMCLFFNSWCSQYVSSCSSTILLGGADDTVVGGFVGIPPLIAF